MAIRKSTVNNTRKKMPVEERAKQFMPFSALKGLDEALREQEIIAEENVRSPIKPYISEPFLSA